MRFPQRHFITMDEKSTEKVEPGFSNLGLLQVNAEDFDYHDGAYYQFPFYMQRLKETMPRPERIVIQNFLGYLATRLGWYKESIEYFNDALNEDQDN